MRKVDIAKVIFWAFGIAAVIVMPLFVPEIWQSLKHHTQPQADGLEVKAWLYVLALWLARWLLIDPITDRLRDIREEMREFNGRSRGG